MPDFAALQDCGAAPKELDFSGSNDPYNKPEYMADKVGLTPEQCEPTPPPTERDLVGQGFRQEPGPGGTNVWTTPPTNGTESASVAVRDHTAIAARPGDPEQPDIVKDPVTGEPRAVPKESPEQQFNKAVNTAASVATAGIAAGIKGDFASIAGLGGAIGDAIGVPFAGEAAALAGKVKDFLDKGGDMASLLNDPLGSMDNLADVLGALGIEVPPVMKAAIGEAKKIADALKQKLPPGGVPGVYCEKEFVARMGTSMTTHGTPLAPGPGALTVLAMGTPVWRCMMDFHLCPVVKGVVPDVGGIVPPTQFVVWAMGAPVARHKVDQVAEIPGGPNKIVPMTQAERAAEEKRKKEEEERKKREEEEKKKREAKEKSGNESEDKLERTSGKAQHADQRATTDYDKGQVDQQALADARERNQRAIDKLRDWDSMSPEEQESFRQTFGDSDPETRRQVIERYERANKFLDKKIASGTGFERDDMSPDILEWIGGERDTGTIASTQNRTDRITVRDDPSSEVDFYSYDQESRAGIIQHESLHAGNNDPGLFSDEEPGPHVGDAGGYQDKAIDTAGKDPLLAVDNADNYRIFSDQLDEQQSKTSIE